MSFLRERLSLGQKLGILGLLFVLGFAAFAWRAQATVERVGVGGPVYDNIIASKDVVADVLPPPMYLVETHLHCYQLTVLKDPALIRGAHPLPGRLLLVLDLPHVVRTAP